MLRKTMIVVAAMLPLTVHAAGDNEFRAVQVSELSRHVGKQVRISLPRGVVREGTLADANPSTITVERSYGRGGMKFELSPKQVEKAEVRD
jgi:hypothetical protein